MGWIAGRSGDTRSGVRLEVIRSWAEFPREDYARAVLLKRVRTTRSGPHLDLEGARSLDGLPPATPVVSLRVGVEVLRSSDVGEKLPTGVRRLYVTGRQVFWPALARGLASLAVPSLVLEDRSYWGQSSYPMIPAAPAHELGLSRFRCELVDLDRWVGLSRVILRTSHVEHLRLPGSAKTLIIHGHGANIPEGAVVSRLAVVGANGFDFGGPPLPSVREVYYSPPFAGNSGRETLLAIRRRFPQLVALHTSAPVLRGGEDLVRDLTLRVDKRGRRRFARPTTADWYEPEACLSLGYEFPALR